MAMHFCVVWYKSTNVSEVLFTSAIRNCPDDVPDYTVVKDRRKPYSILKYNNIKLETFLGTHFLNYELKTDGCHSSFV